MIDFLAHGLHADVIINQSEKEIFPRLQYLMNMESIKSLIEHKLYLNSIIFRYDHFPNVQNNT